jgi:signal transduction histidine kinase
MLGRQQIAGIPTAISELFKNAYDAYADHVEVDFYRTDHLFVLRDDGLGMTREDFETRWLTLGTESKIGEKGGVLLPPADSSKRLRPIMGEKGIGRLAIGVIGPQVMILTRAKREGKLHDLVAAFIHWGLFEIPGIDLEQIEIPILEFPDGTVPSAADVQSMVLSVKNNLEQLRDQIEPTRREKLYAELKSFELDPVAASEYLGTPGLMGEGYGTHFYIRPADELISADIDGEDDENASGLRKMLLGFTNTMTPDHSQPEIKTAFRDHKTDVLTDDLIGESEFWTPDEFIHVDHRIQGEFDDFGQFRGQVSIFGTEALNYVVPWTPAKGRPTECGAFRLNLAYIQGRASETVIEPQEFARITAKATKLGGLYIYRDGIRVLPYGNNDFDFLDIEKNRSKSATHYYFSYRRMFGVIEINNRENKALQEKAGREGFRENKAYRQFRQILKSFFEQIAKEFFREGGAYADPFLIRRAELNTIGEARKRKEKQVTVKRNQFSKDLELFFTQSGTVKIEAEAIIQKAIGELQYVSTVEDAEEAASYLIRVEATARRGLSELRRRIRVVKPNGVALNRQLQRDWEFYQLELGKLESEVLDSANAQLEQTVGDMAQRARIEVSRRRRIQRSLEDLTSDAKKTIDGKSKEVKENAEDVKRRVVEATRGSITDLDEAVKSVFTRFASTDFAGMTEDAIVQTRIMLERDVTLVAEKNEQMLEKISGQLGAVTWETDENGNFVSGQDLESALEEQVFELRDRLDSDVELTQLGMAVGIVNHEFRGTILSIRNNLRTLKAWADVNSELQEIYSGIRTFTPLQRRMNRKSVEIPGHDIRKFLADLFEKRLERNGITLEATKSFKRHQFLGYPSTFYPVFVNLVDNAIYWLGEKQGVEAKIIRLDVSGNAMLISDNGPGIPERDWDAVYEMGFTRKSGGRGMGLYISKDVLGRANPPYDLKLVEAAAGMSTTFKIAPRMLELAEASNVDTEGDS